MPLKWLDVGSWPAFGQTRDRDDAGNAAAGRMMKLYPGIQRLSPSAHDWNDVLTR